jgi:hypothetical protein
MKHFVKATSVAASLALMVAAPAAVASGGKAFAGGATGGGGTTTTTTTTAGGGGGGGTGGGTQTQNRGATDPALTTAPAPAPAPTGPACATFTSATAPVGYYLTYAALWHDYQVKSCNNQTENVSVRATDVNRATGASDYTVTVPYTLASGGGSVTGVLDNDFAPFSTTYDIKMELVDQAGNVLDTSLLTATTPDPR